MASLKFLAPNVFKTFQRFPISIVCSIGLYALSFDLIENKALAVVFAHLLTAGFFTFGITRLAAEAHGFKPWVEGMIGFVATIAAFFVLSLYGSPISYLLLGIIFMLSILVVPFLFRRSDDVSFWAFQQNISTGIILAFISSILFVAGLSLALLSLHYLFDMQIGAGIYSRIMLFAAIVYGPFNALSWIPEKFETAPAECHSAPGLPFMLNWILAPLATIYFLILYAYGLKILVEWELPRGNVGYMVTGFGALGTLIYLSGWIMRDTGNFLVKFLYKHFFKLLILPIVLLFVGIVTRINDYGLTEQRYFVVLFAIWFSGLSVLYTFRPQAPLKIILTSLVALLLVSSFGPWGAISLSERIQYGRLADILKRNGMMADSGVIVRAENPLAAKEVNEISSIVDYFIDKRRPQKLQALFPGVNFKERYQAKQSVAKFLGIAYVSEYARKRGGEGEAAKPYTEINVYARQSFPRTYDVAGYDQLFLNVNAVLDREVDTQKRDAVLSLRDGRIVLHYKAQEIRLAETEQLTSFISQAVLDPKKPYMFEVTQGKFKVRYNVSNAMIWDYGQGKYELRSVGGDLLVAE